MAIRYDKKLRTEIKKLVKNYNAKIKRLEGKEGITLPSRISFKSIRSRSKNRADLRRLIKNLAEFTKRGGEKNITVKGRVIPRYQFNQAKRFRSLIKRRLKAREEFAKTTYPTYEGVKERFTIAEQFDEEIRNIEAQKERLLDVDFLDFSTSEMSKYLVDLEANARTVNLTQWQQNYADMLLDVGYVHGINHQRLHDLREKLLSLSPAQFDKLFKTESTIKQIIYYYNQVNELGVDIPYTDKEHEDVMSVYDSLVNNIDTILKDYK